MAFSDSILCGTSPTSGILPRSLRMTSRTASPLLISICGGLWGSACIGATRGRLLRSLFLGLLRPICPFKSGRPRLSASPWRLFLGRLTRVERTRLRSHRGARHHLPCRQRSVGVGDGDDRARVASQRVSRSKAASWLSAPLSLLQDFCGGAFSFLDKAFLRSSVRPCPLLLSSPLVP